MISIHNLIILFYYQFENKLTNTTLDNKYCSKCSYPLVPSAFDEIKETENRKFQTMEERFNNMQSMLEKLIAGLYKTRLQINNKQINSGRCITTWNHYLSHLKYFFRWLHNMYNNNNKNNDITTAYPSSYDDWETPSFIQIKEKT